MVLRKGCCEVKHELCLKCVCRTCENKHCLKENITSLFKGIKHNCLCKTRCDSYMDWVKIMFLSDKEIELRKILRGGMYYLIAIMLSIGKYV